MRTCVVRFVDFPTRLRGLHHNVNQVFIVVTISGVYDCFNVDGVAVNRYLVVGVSYFAAIEWNARLVTVGDRRIDLLVVGTADYTDWFSIIV